MKKVFVDYLGLTALAAIVIACDQWTKYLLRSQLAIGESWSPWSGLSSIIQIVHTQNSGAAFSMGRELGPLFSLLAIIISSAILYYYPRLTKATSDLAPRVAMGLILGGALGNLIDRLTAGDVTDFIAINHFAVVNIADICISLGAAVFILWTIRKEIQEKKRSASDNP